MRQSRVTDASVGIAASNSPVKIYQTSSQEFSKVFSKYSVKLYSIINLSSGTSASVGIAALYFANKVY